MKLQLEIAGILLLGLGLAHVFFDRYFGWNQELASVSLFTRRVFQVHCFFIALVLVLMGVGSLFYADSLLEATPLSRILLSGIVVFWVCRLFVQFFVYDPSIWKGDRFRTWMHVAFSGLWIYLIGVYGCAWLAA